MGVAAELLSQRVGYLGKSHLKVESKSTSKHVAIRLSGIEKPGLVANTMPRSRSHVEGNWNTNGNLIYGPQARAAST